MFDEYAKKLENLGAETPKIFNAAANWGAKKVVNEAKEITDRYEKVDTGNYKRNWYAEKINPEPNVYGIELQNSAEYATFIEDGYKLKNGGRVKGFFIGKNALDNTEGKIILKLQEELNILMAQKKHGISRAEAKKYFT